MFSGLFNVLDHDMVSITLKADLDQNYYNLKDTLNIIQFLDNNYTVSIPEDNKPSIIIDTNNKKEESYSKSLDYKIYAPFILLIILLVLFIPFKRLKNKK